MNKAILGEEGTVMQFVGDGDDGRLRRAAPAAPTTPTARSARPRRCTAARPRSTRAGSEQGLAPLGLGIGLSTGEVAAALLGSEERLEYTLVGDTVNLSQRLQQWAEPGEIVLSDATYAVLTVPCEAEPSNRPWSRAGTRPWCPTACARLEASI